MFERMTMEEIFIVTYIGILIVSVLLAIPVNWIFEKDNKNSKNNERNREDE